MVATYRYPKPADFDPHYLRGIIRREVGEGLIGWTETKTEIRLYFDEELSEEQKAKLDEIMRDPPRPRTVCELSPPDLESEVEAKVGVRPVAVLYDPATGACRLYFDRELSEEQRKRAREVLESIRARRPPRRRPF